MSVTQFNAALIAAGDPQPVPTVVALNGSNLELSVGSDNVGSWPVADLEMERVLGGFKMQVEGEMAILRFDDPEPFAEALGIITGSSNGTKTKKRSKGDSKPAKQPKAKRGTKPKAERKSRKSKSPQPTIESWADEAPPVETTSDEEPPAQPQPKPEKTRSATSGMTKLDARLEGWSRKWGNYLPDWIFTKGGLLVLLGVTLMIIAKPGWFSVIFLILAAVGLAASAIAMLDQVVATRIFRRGYTPIHGLILSLMIGLVGIVLGAF